MRKVIPLLLLTLCNPVVIGASERSKRLENATVYVETSAGTKCSGFVSDDAYAGNKDLVITAAHCDGPGLTVNGQPTKVKAKFQWEDLLVLEVEDTGKPALRLALKDPDVEDRVTSVGFGLALKKPLLRQAYVSQVGLRIAGKEFDSEYIAIDAPFVGGQSGGPVVNANENVVMIVQFGTPQVGFGVGAEIIKKKVGKYFRRAN